MHKQSQVGQIVRRMDRRTDALPSVQTTDRPTKQPTDGHSLLGPCVGALKKSKGRPNDSQCTSENERSQRTIRKPFFNPHGIEQRPRFFLRMARFREGIA